MAAPSLLDPASPPRLWELHELPKPLTVETVFGAEHAAAPLEIELGAGRGDFIRDYAALHPERRFLALERKRAYIGRAVAKVQGAGLANVCLICAEMSYLLRHYVPPGTAAAIHIYFPDPYPKRRHVGRRFFHEENLALVAQALAVGGALHLRTDVESYFRAQLALVAASGLFVPAATTPDLLGCATNFEKRFVRDGLPIYRQSFVRVEPQPPPRPSA